MQKIPTLFMRRNKLVCDAVTPGCEWVMAGEGIATRKLDGSCCMIYEGVLYKRYEVKKDGKTPADFIAATDIDEVTGKQQGWVLVGNGPEDRWHREAFAKSYVTSLIRYATFELVGPKIQGNPEGYSEHTLVNHLNYEKLRIHPDPVRTFNALEVWLAQHDVEGIVWHHQDGRMCKLKKRDFGMAR